MSWDLQNWQSLLIEASFGVGFAVYLYRLQKKNDKNINEIITRIDTRQRAKKRFWLSVVVEQIQGLKKSNERVLEYYKRAFRSYGNVAYRGPPETELSEMYLDALALASVAENTQLPTLRIAISQLVDLLNDPSLYIDTTHADFDRFVSELSSANFGGTHKFVYAHITFVDANINSMNDLLRRFETEIKDASTSSNDA